MNALGNCQSCGDMRPCTCAREEATLPEAIHAIAEGTFYEDHDWAAGPGLRALRRAEEGMSTFCDRVERGEVRSKRTYAQFCAILGRTPK